MELGRQNADDREAMTVEHELLADHSAVAVEPALPESVSQHDDWMITGRDVVRRSDDSAENRVNAEQVEVVSCDDGARGERGVFVAAHAHGDPAPGRHSAE